jgi:hypothetical protein
VLSAAAVAATVVVALAVVCWSTVVAAAFGTYFLGDSAVPFVAVVGAGLDVVVRVAVAILFAPFVFRSKVAAAVAVGVAAAVVVANVPPFLAGYEVFSHGAAVSHTVVAAVIAVTAVVVAVTSFVVAVVTFVVPG